MSVTDVNPILQAGFGAHQDGELEIAAQNYRHALKLAPDHPDALHLLGLVHLQNGEFDEARDLIARSVSIDPENPQALDHLGTALLQAGAADEAIAAFDRALRMAPEFCECWFNLGNAREAAGDLDGARSAFEKAIALDPQYGAAHANLANASIRMRDFDAALAAAETALAIEPTLAPAWISRGTVFKETGRPAEAAEAFGQALLHGGPDADIHCLIADCQHDLDRHDIALENYRAAVAVDPNLVDAHVGIAFCLMHRKEYSAATDALNMALAVSPGNRRALAYKAVLLELDGRLGEAKALMNFDADLCIEDLPVPAGFDDRESFNIALAEAIKTDPRLTPDAGNKSTRGGADVVLVFEDRIDNADGPIAAFFETLRNQIDTNLRNTQPRTGHPHFGAIPSRYRLTSWATVLDTDGQQQAHIHPSAWMSGVYYAELPENFASGGNEHDGWLVFGGSGYGLPECGALERHIEPQVGRLVMFPSYYFHRTVPFRTDGQRISIAFDVIPVA